MEIKVGIQNVAREVILETTDSAADVLPTGGLTAVPDPS